jgi:hypothetical protein
MVTKQQIEANRSIRIRTRGAYEGQVSSNAQRYVWTVELIYTTRTGKRLVVGAGRGIKRAVATEAAYDAAVRFFNEKE